jgi:hypothetical protein
MAGADAPEIVVCDDLVADRGGKLILSADSGGFRRDQPHRHLNLGDVDRRHTGAILGRRRQSGRGGPG